jgi:hypothetical protein
MPAASDEQVPKPLTYTLMYHFLWCVLFWLSALTLFFLFAGHQWGFAETYGPPAVLGVLGLVAGLGAFATYVVRVQLMLGELSKQDGFRWSSRSSWAVIVLAPPVFAALTWARSGWGAGWSVPLDMTIAVAQIEVAVWWMSHLLSVRGLTRGRKRYLGTSPAQAAQAAQPARQGPALAN